MYEVEVKVRADHDAVADRLASIGAERRATVAQADTYYDHPSRSFAETDEAVRVRRERTNGGEPTVTLTYKGPLVEAASKTREELEVEAADGDALDAILRVLDFAPVATVEKERERHAVGDYLVTLDRVEGLGKFVEVEAEGREGEIDALRNGAYELLDDLDLDPDAQLRTSYLELLLDG